MGDMSLTKWLLIDEKVTWSIRLKEDNSPFKPVAAFFAHSGDSWFIELALLLIWLFTIDKVHQLVCLMAGAVAILAILVLSIKFLIRRPRPEGEWGAIYRNTDPHSFPSGHAARVAMLTFLAFAGGFSIPGIILLVWALLVCLARIWMGVHYLSDILAGIVLGTLFGWVITLLTPWFIKAIPWVFTNQTSLQQFFK
jgi:membrane-associated phospholipid phosphatase